MEAAAFRGPLHGWTAAAALDVGPALCALQTCSRPGLRRTDTTNRGFDYRGATEALGQLPSGTQRVGAETGFAGHFLLPSPFSGSGARSPTLLTSLHETSNRSVPQHPQLCYRPRGGEDILLIITLFMHWHFLAVGPWAGLLICCVPPFTYLSNMWAGHRDSNVGRMQDEPGWHQMGLSCWTQQVQLETLGLWKPSQATDRF